MSKNSDSFSIRQVIDLTGLSEYTLRGWENRYKAFRPRRSATGRRSYSHSDLQKALLLRELTLRDFKIGEIAELSNRDLESLLKKKAESHSQPPGQFRSEVKTILRALSLQNWDAIEAKLRKLIRSAKGKSVLTGLFVPLVKELSQMVASGTASISQEHIFSSLLRESLYMIRQSAPRANKNSRFICAAPEGDFHELGILIAHTMLAHSGFRSLYLGANTPKKDLCETALRFSATHLVVGSTLSREQGAKEDLYSYIHFLSRHVNPKIEVWIGGRNVETLSTRFERKILAFNSLLEFEKALQFTN